MKKVVFSSLLLVGSGVAVAAVVGAPTVKARSYEEVRDHVLANPLTVMPKRDPIGPGDLAVLARAAYMGSGALAQRATGLFVERTDLRSPAQKLTHSAGVCMEATWAVTSGPGTGLLAPGTHVPALVRLSVANNQVQGADAPRSFALGIKIFPAESTASAVLSVNLVTNDQFGINGIARPSVTQLAPEHGPIIYSNHIGGAGPVPDMLMRAFLKIDPKPSERPLYPLTTVTSEGATIGQPVTPDRIHFIQRKVRAVEPKVDFREELLQYETNELVFDMVLPPQSVVPNGERIGVLTLGKPMVTEACDLELTFFHHPTDPAKNPF
jgi:hypothetical protein